jgi:hypothetical protein
MVTMRASTQFVRPMSAQPVEIRCNVGDAMVANLAVHLVFFFPRRLDTSALLRSFEQTLTILPLFAGRMTLVDGGMAIRCGGQGVPFTCVSSDRTLADAVASISSDSGGWLVDEVKGATARWGLGPLCKVRVTHLACGATALGLSWHHAIGDMATLMIFMNAWVAAAAGKPITAPVVVEDRAAYLDAHLPRDGAIEPGVRCLGPAEFARSALYLAKDARKQRTLSVSFGEDEIADMRDSYGSEERLSANDVVCARVAEAVLQADPSADRRTLAIAVNVRDRCGLDPMLVGNIITTLNIDLRRGDTARSIAERIRYGVDHFVDEHLDTRTNQHFLDAAGAWRRARCVSRAFDPAQWNPVVSNWSGFGVYRLHFKDTFVCHFAPVLKMPVAGLGALLDGPGGRGLIFQMSLPPGEFEAVSRQLVRNTSTGSSRRE